MSSTEMDPDNTYIDNIFDLDMIWIVNFIAAMF